MHARRVGLSMVLPIAFALSRTAGAATGDPLPGLSAGELQRFTDGKEAFEETEDAAAGLGPIFNGTSCGQCHNVGGTGGGSEKVETRFGATTNGAFDPLTNLGGSLIQTDGIGAAGACTFVGEVVPPQATIRAGRRTTPLFGLGLVDAVPDAAFQVLAAVQARLHRSTAGRVNVVSDIVNGRNAVGKFGWKAQVPNLEQFSGDAYLNEMGITTPLFPDESCPQGNCALLACDPVPGVDDDLEDVDAFADFMSFLAPPPGTSHLASTGAVDRRLDPPAYQGSRVFSRIGCDDCHVQTLATGASPVQALRFKVFHPYSDFLLHDMGSLGDGIAQGRATGREMRTAPLWGVGLFTTFLHDGRATSLEQAILAHDGQGRAASVRFSRLSPQTSAALIAFLRSL